MTAPPRSRTTASGWRWGLPALLLLLPFLAWPLGAMVWRAAAPDAVPSASTIGAVLGDRFYWERLGFTTAQAAASAALAVLVGLPVAYVFSQIRFPGRTPLLAMITVPLVLPTIVVALAFQQLLGPNGWLNDMLRLFALGPVHAIGTLWAILAAHVFYNVAIVVRLVSRAWANLDARQEEEARLLGAGRLRTFRHVTLPALLPAIASAAALAFTFAFTSFGVVLILGAPRYDTLEVTIYRLATQPVSLPEAAMLSLVQLAATLAMLALTSALQRRTAGRTRQRVDRARPIALTSWIERLLMFKVALVLGVLIFAPMAALVYGALTRDGALSGANYVALLRDSDTGSDIAPLDAVRWSLTFAAGATVIALIGGGGAAMAVARARGRVATLLTGVLMLPLAMPAVALGFGYLLTFDRGWYDLRGTPWLVLLAHALIAYPFVLRAVLAVARSLNPRLREAASVLGASPWRAWRLIELPIMARALVVGAAFAFAVSMGELGATLLLRRREFSTIPIAIYEALGSPGAESLGRALALSTILMAVTVVAFALIERFRYRDAGEC